MDENTKIDTKLVEQFGYNVVKGNMYYALPLTDLNEPVSMLAPNGEVIDLKGDGKDILIFGPMTSGKLSNISYEADNIRRISKKELSQLDAPLTKHFLHFLMQKGMNEITAANKDNFKTKVAFLCDDIESGLCNKPSDKVYNAIELTDGKVYTYEDTTITAKENLFLLDKDGKGSFADKKDCTAYNLSSLNTYDHALACAALTRVERYIR